MVMAQLFSQQLRLIFFTRSIRPGIDLDQTRHIWVQLMKEITDLLQRLSIPLQVSGEREVNLPPAGSVSNIVQYKSHKQPWNIGKMETWNAGILKSRTKPPRRRSFHHSKTPLFHHSSPLSYPFSHLFDVARADDEQDIALFQLASDTLPCFFQGLEKKESVFPILGKVTH